MEGLSMREAVRWEAHKVSIERMKIVPEREQAAALTCHADYQSNNIGSGPYTEDQDELLSATISSTSLHHNHMLRWEDARQESEVAIGGWKWTYLGTGSNILRTIEPGKI
jgi:hypothetical protein